MEFFKRFFLSCILASAIKREMSSFFFRAPKKGLSFFSCGGDPVLERVDLRSQKEGIFGQKIGWEGWGGQGKKRKKGCAKKGGKEMSKKLETYRLCEFIAETIPRYYFLSLYLYLL